MRKMNCISFVMLVVLCITPFLSHSQALTLTATANSYYPGYEPAKAVDKNTSTAFSNYGNPYLLTVTFNKTVKAATIRILANTPGLYVLLKSEEYTRTLLNDEIFNVIDPSGFNSIVISGNCLIYEVEATEIALNAVTMPLTYDASGNNTYRKIVIGSLKVGELTPEDTVENDQTVIENLDGLAVSIYPNPTHACLIIRLDGNANTELTNARYFIYNIDGNACFEGEWNPAGTLVDLFDQPAGVYFLRINYKDQNLTYKIFKQ